MPVHGHTHQPCADMAPQVCSSWGATSLAYPEGMESVSQWINGRYTQADDWRGLG